MMSSLFSFCQSQTALISGTWKIVLGVAHTVFGTETRKLKTMECSLKMCVVRKTRSSQLLIILHQFFPNSSDTWPPFSHATPGRAAQFPHPSLVGLVSVWVGVEQIAKARLPSHWNQSSQHGVWKVRKSTRNRTYSLLFYNEKCHASSFLGHKSIFVRPGFLTCSFCSILGPHKICKYYCRVVLRSIMNPEAMVP